MLWALESPGTLVHLQGMCGNLWGKNVVWSNCLEYSCNPSGVKKCHGVISIEVVCSEARVGLMRDLWGRTKWKRGGASEFGGAKREYCFPLNGYLYTLAKDHSKWESLEQHCKSVVCRRPVGKWMGKLVVKHLNLSTPHISHAWM